MARGLTPYNKRGFSLLEVTIALSISGMLFTALWQLTTVASQQQEVTGLADQITTLSVGARRYISDQAPNLLALPQLATLNSVARIKITDSDAGDTATSLLGAEYLPANFSHKNAYNQTYAMFVRREDSGKVGIVDSSDRLIALIISTGGKPIPDQIGAKLASRLGAWGGFIYREGNPAPPAAATTAKGAAAGWQISLSATGWSSLGSLAQAGHVAVLVNLITSGIGIGGGGGTNSTLDQLSDAKTDYAAGNLFAGEHGGDAITTGSGNTGLGPNALRAVTGSIANAALGTGALDRHTIAASVYGYHTALGFDALGTLTTGYNYHTAVGARAMALQNGGRGSTGIGFEALYSSSGLDGTTGVGHLALRNITGQHSNTCIGAFCMYTNSISGSNVSVGAYSLYKFNVWSAGNNTVLGAWAGFNLYSAIASGARYNTLLGYQAGSNLTTAESNIVIGANVNAVSATAYNQINIGNTLYSNSSAKWLSIGNPTPTAGVEFDTHSTNSSRLSSGSSAQRPACTSDLVGAQRWNVVVQSLEFCNGSDWMQLPLTYGSGTPPDPPVGSGFLVLTQTRWNGALGGTAGARTKCFNELTSNTNWMYYNVALSRGQLTLAKIQAKMITIPGTPNTAYYFSRVGDITVGGAAIELDGAGSYSGNNTGAWSGKNYFGGSYYYWTGNGYGNTWTSYQNNPGEKCDPIWNPAFQNGTSSVTGVVGYSGATNQGRWWSGSATCDNLMRLMCLVNP